MGAALRYVKIILLFNVFTQNVTRMFCKRISAVLPTYTPELSVAEKKAWAELAIWVGALLFIWMRLTAGVDVLGQSIGFTVIEQSATRVFRAYLGVGIGIVLALITILLLQEVARNIALLVLYKRS